MIIPNWRDVLKKAWSMRLMETAAVLSGLETALPLFSYELPHGVFAGLSFVAVVGAYIARLLMQESLHGTDQQET